MADTDWGGLLGTVILGGVAIKMTQGMFGNQCSNCNTPRKKKKKGLTSPKSFFGGASPF